jgi:serine/threonine protein kinase
MVEMITQKPLFPGDSEIDQLFRIFRVLGTPTEQIWAGVTTLPDFKPTFPQWSAKTLASVPGLENETEACDLLAKMLIYEPAKRISAREALKHPYFNELNQKQKLVTQLQQQQANKLYTNTTQNTNPNMMTNNNNSSSNMMMTSNNAVSNNMMNVNNKRPAA